MSTDALLSNSTKKSVVFTLEHGAHLPPGGHPTLTGVLAHRRLQEEDRDAAEEEEHKVRDEEDTCQYTYQLKRVTCMGGKVGFTRILARCK